MGLGGFGPLGAQSTFQGTLRSVQSRDGPSGELFGEFAGVELERLVSDRLPSAISGPAEIQVKMARFHGGRLQDAAAAMAAGPGMVSRSLVEAAVQHLGLTGGVGIDRPDRLIPYEKLAAWVTCDAKGLRIQGLSPGESPRTILAGQRGPILSQSQSPATPLPLAAMARALTPEAEDLLPLARKSDDMLRRLPASEAPSPADGENSLR